MANRNAGTLQGVTLILIGYMPTLAFISLPAVLPRLISHFSDYPGAGTLVPLLVTAPALLVAILSPVLGWTADLIGRRALLLYSLAIYTACGVVPVFLDDLIGILISRAGLGIGIAALLTIGTTLYGDYYEEKERNRWFAINGVAGSILATLAILAGGLLADALGWWGPFTLHAIGLPIFVLAWYALWEPKHIDIDSGNAKPESTQFPWKRHLGVCSVSSVVAFIFFIQPVHIGIALDEVGVDSSSKIAVISMLASIGVPFGALIYSRISMWPVATQLTIMLGLNAIGLIGIGLSETYWWVGIASLPQQAGNGMAFPILWAWCQNGLSFKYRARGMGIWSTFFLTGQFLCPLITGFISVQMGSIRQALFVLGFFALAVAVFAALVRLRGVGKKANPVHEENLALGASIPVHMDSTE
ncbi:MFS transporter [Pseudomaricurvus alcaniphilus]|uniref:MFS transporter n=1 Tax=Pseudomaricurvus alcaniphilus TaxID=1166482 RepID=UPI00140B7F3D|nr:MFS transporter [Pseudomaricurvus alcaniphilus]NHN36863.1 MFS transporter [Pseudomaricurvus alcaniphilus]